MLFLGVLASLLAAWHVNADLEARYPSANSFVFDSVFWVDRGDWKCTSQQVKRLNKAIDEARVLTQSAVNALSAPGSEGSFAFRSWFGDKMKFPKISKQKGNGVTENSLVYACPPVGDNYCQNPKSLASVRGHVPGEEWHGPTLMILCQSFFASKSTINDVATNWRVSGRVGATTNAGQTLVHEYQHMTKVTGQSNACNDVPDPFTKERNSVTGRPRACYSPDWYHMILMSIHSCRSISDQLKIKNAENYNIFAGFVYAWPEKAKSAY
ncbi:hypothetical protein LZ32DRAFT_536705 [Colletotrichum eremochloae]|nr:hypothetical protein LZ32DRAFT_536705 [Colletotrichum eremochloae]